MTGVSFTLHQLFAAESNPDLAVTALDIDADADIDFVVGDASGLWMYDTVSDAEVDDRVELLSTSELPAQTIAFLDMDQDGDWDAYGRYPNGRRIWFQRLADGTFDSTPISTLNNQQFADLDGDGDLDGIALLDLVGIISGRFVWNETAGAEIGFGVEHPMSVELPSPSILSTPRATAQQLLPADIDQDGDLDLFSVPSVPAGIDWYENVDGKGAFGPRQEIDANMRGLSSAVADFDNDGHPDLFAATGYDDQYDLRLYRRQGDGWHLTGVEDPNGADFLTDLQAVDLDQDGLLDLIGVSISPNGKEELRWLRQLPGDEEGPTFEWQPSFPTDVWREVSILDVADIDNDGDPDLLLRVGQSDGPASSISWLEVTHAAEWPVGDVTQDGQITFADFLTISANYGNEVNRGTNGDLDEDGRVTFADFLILSAVYPSQPSVGDFNE